MGLLAKVENKVEKRAMEIKTAPEKTTPENILLPPQPTSPATVQTDIDKLHSLVLKYNQVAISDAAKILKTDGKRIEELAGILNKYGIAELYYPSVGHAIVRQISPEKKVQSRKNKKLNLMIFALGAVLVVIIVMLTLHYFNFFV